MGRIKIGAFISGGGSNLQAVIDACASGSIDGKIVFVGSDNPEAAGLLRAEKAGIPTFVTPYEPIIKSVTDKTAQALPEDADLSRIMAKQGLFKGDVDRGRATIFFISRILAERALLDHMSAFEFDLLILAGFMRTLTPYFIDRVNVTQGRPRIMNIHPALLPSFPGVDGYADTFNHGCKVGGCTVHFIDYGEDTGPIIGQKSFEILPHDTLESVKKKGLEMEWQLYPECIRLFAQNRLKLEQRKKRTVAVVTP